MKLIFPDSETIGGDTLYEFQKEGLLDQLKAPMPVIYNGDDMGLGKTIQALVYANSTHSTNVLIICPAGARLNWARESNKWFTMKPGTVAKPLLSAKDVSYIRKKNLLKKIWEPSPIIISYDQLVRTDKIRTYVLEREWDLVICDEFHQCKNISAKRTKIVYNDVFPIAKRIYLMSGTPITNSSMDLYPFLSMVVPHSDNISDKNKKICSDYEKFGDTFCYRWVHPTWGVQYRNVRNPAKLKELLNETGLFFRRTKEAVLTDLPEKTYVRVDLPLKVDVKLSDSKLNEFLNEFKKDDGTFASKATSDTALMTIRRKLGEAKATCQFTYEYIEELLNTYNKPVVVFAYHKNVIATLKQRLRKYNPVTFDGSCSPKEKQRAVDLFQEGDSQVFIGQIQSAGVAITLTRSCDVVFLEYDWLSVLNEQAVDRVYRIGQKNAVMAHYLVSEHPFDSALVDAMIMKQKQISKVI